MVASEGEDHADDIDMHVRQRDDHLLVHQFDDGVSAGR